MNSAISDRPFDWLLPREYIGPRYLSYIDTYLLTVRFATHLKLNKNDQEIYLPYITFVAGMSTRPKAKAAIVSRKRVTRMTRWSNL